MGKRMGITYLKIPPGRHSRESGDPEDGYRLPPGRPLVAPAPLLVTPAKAGAWGKGVLWIPAFAGMTKGAGMTTGAGRGRGDEGI